MAKQTKALVKQAEALGIDVDGRWGDETIQERIDAAGIAKEGERSAAEKAAADVARLEGEAGAGDDADELAGAAQGAGQVGAVVLSGAAVDSEPAFDEAETAGSIAVDDAARAADGGEPDGEHGGGDPDRSSGSDGDLPLTDDPFAEAEDAQDDDADEDDVSDDETGALDGNSGDDREDGGSASGEAGADGGSGVVGHDTAPAAGADLGDGSAAGVVDGTFSRRDRVENLLAQLEVVQRAMTSPIVGAFDAASGVYGALGKVSGEDRRRWFSEIETAEDGGLAIVTALVSSAVPFVRTWPKAPPEALYITVREEAAALELAGGWLDLPWEKRVAWETFRDVLVRVDQLMAAEEARAQAAERGAAGVRRVPIDETTLEMVDDPMGLSELGRLAAKRSAAEDAALGAALKLQGL